MASDIYGRPITKADEAERQLGKAAILGLGYQMGPSKFVATAATYGIELIEDVHCAVCGHPSGNHRKMDRDHWFEYKEGEEGLMTAVKVVKTYREKYWRVKQMWQEVEDAAIEATENPNTIIDAGKVTFCFEDGFLFCRLPSGRCLAYPEPEVHMATTSWGALKKQLTFMTTSQYTHQWCRESTYGGKLVENIDQAISRDLLAAAMWRAEKSGTYKPVLSVHDEIIAEALLGAGSVEGFNALMAKCPDWATNCPVEAEGWAGPRYRK